MKAIEIETNNKELSAFGGLKSFDEALTCLSFSSLFKDSSFQKFKSLVLGFVAGLECIDDISHLNEDPLFLKLIGRSYSDATLGDFLRSFRKIDLENLQSKLHETAMSQLRSKFHDSFVIYSSDSTPNVQHGQKIEGVAFNYKNLWCLDTLGIFDHRGFCHALDVRAGNTYSSNGNTRLLNNVLRRTPEGLERYFHGDSAFANLDHYNVCIANQCKFVMALKANSWKPLLKDILKWRKTELDFMGDKNCEIAQCRYIPDGLQKLKSLRVVLIRSKRKSGDQMELWEGEYKYYGFVTNIEEHELLPVMKNKKVQGRRGTFKKLRLGLMQSSATMENIINFYRSRGNTENFIKDQKYGFDLKHYPCRKLSANKAFGLIGAVAYNLMRLSSFVISKNGCFAKRIRLRLVHIPCQIVTHARRVTIKMKSYHKEVCGKLSEISKKLSLDLVFKT